MVIKRGVLWQMQLSMAGTSKYPTDTEQDLIICPFPLHASGTTLPKCNCKISNKFCSNLRCIHWMCLYVQCFSTRIFFVCVHAYACVSHDKELYAPKLCDIFEYLIQDITQNILSLYINTKTIHDAYEAHYGQFLAKWTQGWNRSYSWLRTLTTCDDNINHIDELSCQKCQPIKLQWQALNCYDNPYGPWCQTLKLF